MFLGEVLQQKWKSMNQLKAFSDLSGAIDSPAAAAAAAPAAPRATPNATGTCSAVCLTCVCMWFCFIDVASRTTTNVATSAAPAGTRFVLGVHACCCYCCVPRTTPNACFAVCLMGVCTCCCCCRCHCCHTLQQVLLVLALRSSLTCVCMYVIL